MKQIVLKNLYSIKDYSQKLVGRDDGHHHSHCLLLPIAWEEVIIRMMCWLPTPYVANPSDTAVWEAKNFQVCAECLCFPTDLFVLIDIFY